MIGFVLPFLLSHAQQPGSTQATPLRITAEQDHKAMMDALHITSIRSGKNGMNPRDPNYANYDEAKANPYPVLPDPLVFKNGKPVKSARDWRRRRSEIVEDFDREIYGRVPRHTPKVNWEVASTTRGSNGLYNVITKKLIGHVDNSSYPSIKVDIQVSLSTPMDAKGPVPVMMEFGFAAPAGVRPGGARLGAGPVPAPRLGPPPGGGGPTWQQQVLAKGWGYAT